MEHDQEAASELPEDSQLEPSRLGSPSRRQLVQAMMATAGVGALGALMPTHAYAAGGDLVIALPNNPSTFDPIGQANHDAMVVTQTIFENLVTVDAEGNLQPQLAKALPTITNDGKTYTFDLREGVLFQNGQPFTAEDVKYSFDYVLDPKNNALRRPLFDRIATVTVENKHRVRFDLKEPYRPWLYYMSKYMGIFPIGSREKHDANYFRSGPVGLGTGPGVFVEWKQNDRVVLKKNPTYWKKGFPAWDKAVIRIIPDEGARLAYLLTGNVDIISGTSPKNDAMLKQKKEIATSARLALGGWLFFMLNNKKAPFDDVNVRRAIACSVDRQLLAKKVYYGMVEPAAIPAPPGSWWYDKSADDINQFNKARAKEYMKKSKYAGGAEFDMLIPSQTSLIDVKEAAVVIQAQLAEIGLKVNIKEMERGILLEQTRLGNHVSSLQAWMSPGEPTYMIDLCYGKDNVFSKSSGYENAETWKLIDETYRHTDQAKLKPIFAKVLTQLALDSPHVWLGFIYASNAWRTKVQDFKVDQGLTMRISDVSKS